MLVIMVWFFLGLSFISLMIALCNKTNVSAIYVTAGLLIVTVGLGAWVTTFEPIFNSPPRITITVN